MYKKIDIYTRSRFNRLGWQYETRTLNTSLQKAKDVFCRRFGLDSWQVKTTLTSKEI